MNRFNVLFSLASNGAREFFWGRVFLDICNLLWYNKYKQNRIDEIEIGNKVWAYNVETGETELKTVTKVYIHSVDEILHLYTDEGDVDTTSNHPFYVIGKGWVAAGDLAVGDEVYNLDGTTSTILGSEVDVLDEPVLVYNLEVEDFHSYFVGCVPVLVHNYLSKRQANKIRDQILEGQDVTFRTKADADNFIKMKFGDYPQEVAGGRSAKGWHEDIHDIPNKGANVPHINIYNKKLDFSVHIFWE